jgi:hypothetical protein
MTASTFFWNTSVSNAFCAPTAPDASSTISSSTLRPRMPPAALISSTANCDDCTTAGATTLFAPDSPTGTPMRIGSAACTWNAKTPAAAIALPRKMRRRAFMMIL